MKDTLVSKMLALVEKAGEGDLDELDKLIAEREQQLEAYVAERRKEIDALQQMRRVCDVKLNGKPQRGRRRKAADGEPAAAPARPPGLADWIAARIEERGPQSTQALAMAKGASESAIRIAIGKAKGRFEINNDEEWMLRE